MQKLKSIDAAWSSESGSSPAPSQSSVNVLGSPLAARSSSTAASIDRVGNTLIDGLSSATSKASSFNSINNTGNRSATIPEHASGFNDHHQHTQTGNLTDNASKPPIHSRQSHSTAKSDGKDDEEDDGEGESDDDEEIGWSPFAVR